MQKPKTNFTPLIEAVLLFVLAIVVLGAAGLVK